MLSFPFYEQISKLAFLHLEIGSGYSETDSCRRSVIKLDIHTMGGAPFMPNFDFSTWLRDVPNNMVTVERYGNPLATANSSSLFPELLPHTVLKMTGYVKASAEKYIDINEKQVSMKTEHQSYERYNKMDNNHGVQGKILGGMLHFCDDINACQITLCNTLVGKIDACPPGHKSIPLHFRNIRNTKKKNILDRFQVYWCTVLNSSSESANRFLFGGFYTRHRDNPLTGAKYCKPHFLGVSMLWNDYPITFCLGSDYELAYDR